MPATALEATVARFNEHARRGEDADFRRPPESLGPVERPLFYGVTLVTPSVSSGIIGLVTSTQAQVLHYTTGQSTPGLYACGQLAAAHVDLGID